MGGKRNNKNNQKKGCRDGHDKTLGVGVNRQEAVHTSAEGVLRFKKMGHHVFAPRACRGVRLRKRSVLQGEGPMGRPGAYGLFPERPSHLGVTQSIHPTVISIQAQKGGNLDKNQKNNSFRLCMKLYRGNFSLCPFLTNIYRIFYSCLPNSIITPKFPDSRISLAIRRLMAR